MLARLRAVSAANDRLAPVICSGKLWHLANQIYKAHRQRIQFSNHVVCDMLCAWNATNSLFHSPTKIAMRQDAIDAVCKMHHRRTIIRPLRLNPFVDKYATNCNEFVHP